jgi:signal transduction histidine kinase/ActR/RegA family two-component response regulator
MLQDAVLQLADSATLLRSVGSLLRAQRAEILAQAKSALPRDLRHPGLEHLRNLPDAFEQAWHVLFEELGERDDPQLKRYLEGVAAWSIQAQRVGIDYAAQKLLFAIFRRALIPFLFQTYQAGPEFQLIFAALDAHEHSVMEVLAAAAIDLAHGQLMSGAHLRSVGRIAGGVAHALNNTLTVLVGRAQILEVQLTDPAQREELRAIQKIARAGADSVRRFQGYAAERQAREPTRLDVNAVVNDVIQLTRLGQDDAEGSGVSIDMAKDQLPVPPVIGQATLLRDALVELVWNGVEAMPRGGLVTLRTDRTGDRVQIVVADQGEGMDPLTQARAGEPFYTTKGAGHLGLGLATAAQIVRGMGGTLELSSAPGQGTRVSVMLPAVAEITPAGDLRAARLARWASMLVVDDEPLVRDVAVRTFELRGIRAVSAGSGSDAVRVMTSEGPFQVALVDLGMPGLNGFETAKALKELNPKAIVILMTGWAAELDDKKMRESGIDRVISKPFDFEQVIQLIHEALAIQDKI